MRITIRTKPLEWKRGFWDGHEVWKAELFGDRVKYMIASDPKEKDRYRMYIGQDFKGAVSDLYVAKEALQVNFDDHLDELIEVYGR